MAPTLYQIKQGKRTLCITASGQGKKPVKKAERLNLIKICLSALL